jgi:hypothetical protein
MDKEVNAIGVAFWLRAKVKALLPICLLPKPPNKLCAAVYVPLPERADASV